MQQLKDLTISPPSFALSIQNGTRKSTSYNHRHTQNIPLCLNISDTEDISQWTLDSGASSHFTHDINDFVEYRLIKPYGIKTATSHTSVIAKGTVLLKVNRKAIRIAPVYHVPELTSKLLSLGQFFKDELHTRGSSKEIALFTETNKRFITFYPRTQGDTIFVIQATVSKPESHAYTIYKVDFEMLH